MYSPTHWLYLNPKKYILATADFVSIKAPLEKRIILKHTQYVGAQVGPSVMHLSWLKFDSILPTYFRSVQVTFKGISVVLLSLLQAHRNLLCTSSALAEVQLRLLAL